MKEIELTHDQYNDYESRYGLDPESQARLEHGLLINGIPFTVLYHFCKKHDLPTDGDIYQTCYNFIRKLNNV